MGKKKPNTPRSRVTHSLRLLWLRSRERAKALKDTGYCCKNCGVKQSTAKDNVVKLEVHHDPPIGDKWKRIIDLIYNDILSAPQYPLCVGCHKEKHKNNLTKDMS